MKENLFKDEPIGGNIGATNAMRETNGDLQNLTAAKDSPRTLLTNESSQNGANKISNLSGYGAAMR